MTVAASSRRTPLYGAHRSLGARMVEFGGWEMPVQYAGILDEHRAVRSKAGAFDVSHMGEIEISGPGAVAACQRLVTNDVGRLRPGGAQYGVLCLPNGGIVDDVVYYRLAEDLFLFCVNAANEQKDFEWMRDQCRGAEIVNRSDEYALIALQGPVASSILAPLTDVNLEAMPRFTAARGRVAGIHALVSRTGYTGEDGFELFVETTAAEALWSALFETGGGLGLVPVGLGARDTLRLEAGLMLYGNDIDMGTTPLEAGLGWVVKLDKGEFVGREALLRQRERGLERRLVGLEMRDASIPRHGYPIHREGRPVGSVTSGTKAPTLGRGIALGYVESSASAVDSRLEVEIRGQKHPASVVKLPFYRR